MRKILRFICNILGCSVLFYLLLLALLGITAVFGKEDNWITYACRVIISIIWIPLLCLPVHNYILDTVVLSLSWGFCFYAVIKLIRSIIGVRG